MTFSSSIIYLTFRIKYLDLVIKAMKKKKYKKDIFIELLSTKDGECFWKICAHMGLTFISIRVFARPKMARTLNFTQEICLLIYQNFFVKF